MPKETNHFSFDQMIYTKTVNAYINRGFTRLDLEDESKKISYEKYGPVFGVIYHYITRLGLDPKLDDERDIWSAVWQEREAEAKSNNSQEFQNSQKAAISYHKFLKSLTPIYSVIKNLK